MEKYIKSESYKMIHLCIDDLSHHSISGTAYNNTIEESIVFGDVHELILKFDKIFDKNGNPQSSVEKRSFRKGEEASNFQLNPQTYCQYEKFFINQGKVNTFDILVHSRRQATWQGVIFYQDKEIEFQSELELIKELSNLLNI